MSGLCPYSLGLLNQKKPNRISFEVQNQNNKNKTKHPPPKQEERKTKTAAKPRK